MDRNEFRTRLEMIDVLLKEQGWVVSDRSRVLVEVDTRQSDFVAKNYKTVSETLKNDMESKYARLPAARQFWCTPCNRGGEADFQGSTCSGQKQAEMYADDIKRQTGKDVFIFLSNGYQIIFWDRERYSPREVKGFYARADLERLRFQKTQDASSPVEVDTNIVDRAKGIECVKRVVEHLQRGHRKGLIVMATGTGKTRVAMAIIKILMEKGLVQKVLFLADRRALRDQAFNKGYKPFFPEEGKDKIFAGKYDTSKRLYVSTIQTFQEIYLDKDKNGQFLLSPGEFDLIISDEAHRSIYNKWKDVFTYFDAIQIGLTATPSEILDKDTLRFFECQDGAPTALYSYDDAVRDGVLVDFRKSILGAQTHFQIAGVKRQDLTEGERARLLEQGIDPDEIDFEGTELEKKVAVKGTSEAIVREFMENCPHGPDRDAARKIDHLRDLEEARVPAAGSVRYALSRVQGHACPDDRIGGFPGGRTDQSVREGVDAPGRDLGGHAGHGDRCAGGLQPCLCQAGLLEDQVLADARPGHPGKQRLRTYGVAAGREEGVFPGL